MIDESESKQLNLGERHYYQAMSEPAKPRPYWEEKGEDGLRSTNSGAGRISILDPDDPTYGRRRKNRTPKKVLHFSDGVLEVYSSSSSEEEDQDRCAASNETSKGLLDPKSLRWIPWVFYYTWWFGSSILKYCDIFGEKLAWMLGITSPKYYYEIQEFERMEAEEAERRKRQGIEAYGWTDKSVKSSDSVEMQQPTTLNPNTLMEECATDQQRAAASSTLKRSQQPSPVELTSD